MNIPQIGLGTHTLKGEECERVVLQAIKLGYSLIDTAGGYKNEEEVGAAIAKSGVARNELFITTKISPAENKKGTEEGVIAALHNSLERLKLPYVDCYMMHWPGIGGLAPTDPLNNAMRRKCWKAMIELKQQGLCMYLGVSNFQVKHFESIMDIGKPDLHQLELHPLCRQQEVVDYCKKHDIKVQQYSPLAKADPRLIDNAAVKAAAEKLHVTVGQVVLLWGIYIGGYDSAAVRSTQKEHLQNNLDVLKIYKEWNARDNNSANGGDNDKACIFKEVMIHLDDVMKGVVAANNGDIHTCWNSSLVV